MLTDRPGVGRVLHLLPAIPDAAPYKVREGIARRRITATTGRCPCGAVVEFGDLAAGTVQRVEVQHEKGCPAITTTLVKALRRWQR